MEENQMTVGEIRIRSVIAETGHPEVAIDLPDTDDVPLVTQLGMLELAKDTLLNGPEEDA